MSATVVDGVGIARRIRERVADETASLQEAGIFPGLGVVLVGDNPASATYVRSKERACKRVGIYSEVIQLPASASQKEIHDQVLEFNKRDDIDGILVQLPLPKGIDSHAIIEAIDPTKDVDGFHPINFGKLTIGLDSFVPATPLGIMEILKEHKVRIEGADAVVLGRSNIVGKPVALLLLHSHATVTICHSRTRDLAAAAREADIVVSAMGRTAMVTPDFIKPGAAVIDVGMNALSDPALLTDLFGEDEERREQLQKKGYTLVGDVHPAAAEVAGLITPVPGGVGPMTIAMLLTNCLKAAKLRAAARG
jgi:methylenetetrahydrofolate dehydrogenase (NADP+)/methenyltetrahydrofolate cyclohydrolase